MTHRTVLETYGKPSGVTKRGFLAFILLLFSKLNSLALAKVVTTSDLPAFLY